MPNVKIIGAVATQTDNVADSGRDSSKSDTKVAMTVGKEVIEFGRS